MVYEMRLGILSLGSLWGLFCTVLLLRSRKDTAVKTGLPVFFLEPLFPAGKRLRKLLRVKGHSDRDRYRKLLEMMTPGEAERVQKSAGSAGYTYVLLLGAPLLLLWGVTGDSFLFFLEVLLLLLLCMYFDYWLNSAVKKRHTEAQTQFPAMLTEMSLMVNVGITAGEAFDRVAAAGDGLLFSEMRLVTESVRNGMPVDEALDTLGIRVPLREMKKFISLYKQNLVKGGPDFPRTLQEMSSMAWTDRKNAARTQGELAEQKLLIPTMFMFVGILILIIVPAFQSLF